MPRTALVTASLTIATVLAGCSNAGAALDFTLDATGSIGVLVYLDRDGSRTPTPFDTTFARAKVSLRGPSGNAVIRSVLTDNEGLARFDRMPLGQYRVFVDSTNLGDSVFVARIDSVAVRITATDTADGAIVRLARPEFSVRAARALPAGRPVFVRGVLLSNLQSFRDTTVHLADSSGFLRLTRASLLGSGTGTNYGDSVAIIGVVSVRDGQPTLDLARIARLVQRPPPVALPLPTATAATADLGRLDAALVQVTGAVISDTVSAAPDFRLTVSDGTGALNVVLDATLNIPRTVFRPGRSINVRGVLVPTGAGSWTLKPRDAGDLVVNN